MAVIVSVVKAGAGATTVVSNLAGPLVELLRDRHGAEARLLVVDADPRCGATELLTGRDPEKFAKTLSTALASKHWLHEAAVALDDPAAGLPPEIVEARRGQTLIPNSAGTRVQFNSVSDLAVLHHLLRDRSLPDVEMVLIDCGAATSDLAEAALIAADHIVGVMAPNAVDAHGLRYLMRKLRLMSSRFPGTELGSLVLTRVDRRHAADLDVLGDLTRQVGDLLREPLIPYSASLKNANNRHLPVDALATSTGGVNKLFADLAEALLKVVSATEHGS